MKKITLILMSMLVTISLISLSPVEANSLPRFKVENSVFATPKGEPQPYVNKDQRTMGSLRLVANALGVENNNIKWDNAKQTATLTKGDRTVQVVVGKKELRVNGKVVLMDTVAEMKQGRVFIPARFIGEALGVYVGYDSLSKSVLFSQNPINELPTNNIEEALGFTVKKQFPITTTVGGLEFTLHEMMIYDFDSEDAQVLKDKYQFTSAATLINTLRQKNVDLKAYLVRSKVTLKNEGKKTIEFGNNNFTPFYYIGVVKGGGATPIKSHLDSHSLAVNQTDMLYRINLEPNESVTGYYYTVIHNSKGMDYLSLSVSNIYDHSEAIRLAEKE